MEIDEAREVRTTCPYCGVGCGVLATVPPPRPQKRRPPPPQNPQNKRAQGPSGGVLKKTPP
ncbi:hypothetical protein, partial [Mesorhizobium sp. M1409]|uniref:hypothetical protein n=1 Tax=Mesorhizobium sp. M1409 TaxID=2957100 RepID=UPI003334E382